MKTILSTTALSLSLALSAPVSAGDQSVAVEITNLTNAIYFTPLLIATHDSDFHLFEVATPASAASEAR